MNELFLTMPIPPSINNDYLKPRGILRYTADRRPYPQATMYETKEAVSFKKRLRALVAKEVVAQGFQADFSKYALVEWTFYFPRTNMDTNNYYKCVLDAITESQCIWTDDNITINKDARIYYDSTNPRLEIRITYLDWTGIFDSEEELSTFVETNCMLCKKGKKIGQKGGCSIYKNALENRIQDEICEGKCNKIVLDKKK